MLKRIITGETTAADYYLAITTFILCVVGGGILGFIVAIIFRGQ